MIPFTVEIINVHKAKKVNCCFANVLHLEKQLR
jgi:hypothetical protein